MFYRMIHPKPHPSLFLAHFISFRSLWDFIILVPSATATIHLLCLIDFRFRFSPHSVQYGSQLLPYFPLLKQTLNCYFGGRANVGQREGREMFYSFYLNQRNQDRARKRLITRLNSLEIRTDQQRCQCQMEQLGKGRHRTSGQPEAGSAARVRDLCSTTGHWTDFGLMLCCFQLVIVNNFVFCKSSPVRQCSMCVNWGDMCNMYVCCSLTFYSHISIYDSPWAQNSTGPITCGIFSKTPNKCKVCYI